MIRHSIGLEHWKRDGRENSHQASINPVNSRLNDLNLKTGFVDLDRWIWIYEVSALSWTNDRLPGSSDRPSGPDEVGIGAWTATAITGNEGPQWGRLTR